MQTTNLLKNKEKMSLTKSKKIKKVKNQFYRMSKFVNGRKSNKKVFY